MNNEKPPQEDNQSKQPGGTGASRSNRPTTIDLKAKEIKSEPAPQPEEPVSRADTQQSEPAASASPESASAGTASSREPEASARDASSGQRSWSLIGAAAAAAIVFFAVGLGAGHWLSGRMSSQQASAPAPVMATPSPELLARIDRLEAQTGTLQKDDPQLQSRLAKLEAQVAAPRASDQQLVARIAAAEAAVKTLADLTATREKRNDDIAVLAREARDHASSAASAAASAQKAQAASPESRADLDAMTARIATLEKSARDSQAELAKRLSADDAKGRFAIAAIALRDAVDSGMPFTAELAAVKSLSGDASAFAALEPFAASGVPSAASLSRELAGLMPSIWKVARKDEEQSGTFLERLQANAGKVFRVRPVGEAVGDDPPSVNARIETRAGNADVRGALAELAKLPLDVRAPAEGWIKKAQARNAAIAAARNVSQTALSALVKPGS